MRLEEAMVIEPPDPFEGGEFDVFEVAPRTTWTNKLGLVEPNDRLGQGVVIRVPSAADRGRSLSTPVRHSWELIREQSPVS